MTTRKKPTPVTEAEVLTRSRRRCCICFGLSRSVEVKAGQIAHLDGDNSNSDLDNLAFLCFEHHDQYDSSTSQSKNFTLPEVKRYREELYEKVLPVIELQATRPSQAKRRAPESGMVPFDAHRVQELKDIVVELLSDMAGPLRSISSAAHRLSISVAMVQRLLFELAEKGTVRIDRHRGSTKKTYSLANSRENRLIDTFAAMIDEKVVTDDRYLCRRTTELDAIIRTASDTAYAVETMFAGDRLSRDAVAKRIRQLGQAKEELGVQDALSVLLIGITTATRPAEEDLKSIEKPGLLIRYVELE
jgi:DNA-binding transcriptional regulator YhcF (GntR family)